MRAALHAFQRESEFLASGLSRLTILPSTSSFLSHRGTATSSLGSHQPILGNPALNTRVSCRLNPGSYPFFPSFALLPSASDLTSFTPIRSPLDAGCAWGSSFVRLLAIPGPPDRARTDSPERSLRHGSPGFDRPWPTRLFRHPGPSHGHRQLPCLQLEDGNYANHRPSRRHFQRTHPGRSDASVLCVANGQTATGNAQDQAPRRSQVCSIKILCFIDYSVTLIELLTFYCISRRKQL